MDELSIEHCLQVLEDGWVGHLAVISEGEPYVAPISYVVVDGQVKGTINADGKLLLMS